MPQAPPPPPARLCLGVTGHRETSAAFAANRAGIEAAFVQVLDAIIGFLAEQQKVPGSPRMETPRLHTLLADGADQIAAAAALARRWELVAPLPFGLDLNVAINAHPRNVNEARALLAGDDPSVVADIALLDRAHRLRELASHARLFELADQDEAITGLFLDALANPQDRAKEAAFNAELSRRVALAGRVMIEQSEILIAVWDGAFSTQVGGTGHTVRMALEAGAPVIWIDATQPARWRVLLGPEALVETDREAGPLEEQLAILQDGVRRAWAAATGSEEHARGRYRRTLEDERWHPRSLRLWHGYRRAETLFGSAGWRARFRSLRQTWETPDQILQPTGSGGDMLANARALPGQNPEFAACIADSVLRRFAWADGVSSHLSDVYRGGMTANFLLAAFAIVGGMAYLPFSTPDRKWLFASFELLVLVLILAITMIGQRHRWHGRWFETRRVAEYLRHAPILLLMGVARAPGRWPRGTDTSWPEWCARHAIREVGLPRLKVTEDYLRAALKTLLLPHVQRQRDYHVAKAQRLALAHHNLDHIAQGLFFLAVLAVALYLLLKGGGVLKLWPKAIAEQSSLTFTYLGVLLPTFGGALAGIRYFGDFERFAAISRITAEKLDGIERRIGTLLEAPRGRVDYELVADLAHAADEVVVSEIESWQSVFGGKHVTVPV